MYARWVNRFSATRGGSWMVKHVASHLDPVIFKASNGRWTMTGPPTLKRVRWTVPAALTAMTLAPIGLRLLLSRRALLQGRGIALLPSCPLRVVGSSHRGVYALSAGVGLRKGVWIDALFNSAASWTHFR